MPIIKSAKKKMRKDVRRTERNLARKNILKGLIKNMRKNPSDKALSDVASGLDKAVKVSLIHKGKADRLKSRLSKLLRA
ncbi:hypothetical protein A2688_02945 [Candidatus Daviesbacteria bacterium RIFCSPHIGHO2_01_FULL_38_8]|nr:MAG: hypothetical protein A2688_02945 [Candidatus Daviesbacteria bacterium RIFCSPHIGHO2_01_FULL_38_8]